ncbi:HlyD family efflux transporter periplasmic adaptor subunit [Algisphaera agarilytica]|uniref:Biotin carboxyl carrier protein n=1 Tax=Algisphaera agarilytica TaxID=1385975 RepID=A0A7X0LM42_9BACT|nr:HlyD family efflux transporter periplasmic adaptor subunit [Algisphaera agarilytica]MBB6431672.1 biotin carboxyl carrier protein [Algisphaera agarilytica]
MSLNPPMTAAQRWGGSASGLVERLVRFSGPPEQFLTELLATQCRLGQATAGAVVRLGGEIAATPVPSDRPMPPSAKTSEIMAVYPPLPATGSPPSWLAHAIELVTQQSPLAPETQVHQLQAALSDPGRPMVHHLVLVPIKTPGGFSGVSAFLLDTDDPQIVQARCQRIELSISLLSLYEMRQVLEQRDADLRGLSTATRVLSASNDHRRFRAAAIALCNEIASRWRADRVSIGLLSGRYVKLRAMSQTEHISRKMALVGAIESAMEESLDQDIEVLHPVLPEATMVNRAAQELSSKHGPSAVCSLPMRRGGEVIGVVTLERPIDQPLTVEEASFLRMAVDLFTPRVLELSETDRWFGARLADSARRSLATVLGPKHTWAKVTAIALLAGVLALIFVPGTIRVEAPFTFQAVTQRSIPAPFEGYLETVEAEPNDVVAEGEALATLNTAELRAELSRLEAEQLGYEKEAKMAAREGSQVERQIAEARVANVEAQLEWLRWQIDHAVIRSPIAGTVVVGDLKQQLGSPVSKGDVLFEVAPLSALRAELWVPDGKIGDVPSEGAVGELAAAAHPGVKLRFEVERINPIAEVIDGSNVFRVRVKLLDTQPWAKPGIEGVAKIDSRQAPIGWVWTRDAINWVRLKLWI